MRIEATVPDATGRQLNELTSELGVTRSQVVEARRGRRVAIVEAETQKTVCEIVSPILSQLEWAAHRSKLVLEAKAMKDLARALQAKEASPALRKLLSKRKR